MRTKKIIAILMTSRFSTVVYNESTEGFAHARRKRRKLARQRSRRTTSGACRPRKIDYAGINNYSQFSYDGLSQNTKIVETVSGSVTSTRQFVASGGVRREERDASSSVTNRFFDLGQTISGTSYFYAKSHPGSVTEMTDGSGVVQAQYAFDPFGRSTKLLGSLDADFQYAGYYIHQRSRLNLTVYRAYSPQFGRWISRDPIEESDGSNLYSYVHNNPTNAVDPKGTFVIVLAGGLILSGGEAAALGALAAGTLALQGWGKHGGALMSRMWDLYKEICIDIALDRYAIPQN